MTNTAPRILMVIEDDPDLAAALEMLFTSEGYGVVLATSGEDGLRLARADTPDLVILDVNLPGIHGPEVCRRLRTFTDVPVLFLTGSGDATDELVGFSVGGDDYVTKPFHPQLLIWRVAALVNRVHAPRSDAPIRAENVVIDITAHMVLVDGVELELTKVESDLLEYLALHQARIISRQQIIEHIWGPWSGDDHVVDVNVSRLRHKLTEAGAPSGLISTHRGIGYRLNR